LFAYAGLEGCLAGAAAAPCYTFSWVEGGDQKSIDVATNGWLFPELAYNGLWVHLSQDTLPPFLAASQKAVIITACADLLPDWRYALNAMRTNLDGVRVAVTYVDDMDRQYTLTNVLDFPRLDKLPLGINPRHAEYVTRIEKLAKGFKLVTPQPQRGRVGP
jgi:hypothetical protein